MTRVSHEVDYVLGTHDDEVTRLGVQHRVWRPRVLDAWRRAGFKAGQRILDIGSGPGFAALDLTEIVGSAGLESFVTEVIASWRADGGEPDIGIQLPTWLEQAGFQIQSLRPIIDVLTPADALWAWPEAFLRVGLERLVSLGRFGPARSAEILRDFERRKAQPGTRWVTPLVLEIIAVRR